ncbi:LysR family transcriptional regulator [Terasakiella sp. A23]|uniref:LysR family transcriptional regulator n=1 Tax=Terasakiella sp. FCG-A23 TaxID=3080561 RepID=UPI0029535F8F|nr:LysR family transcriptional regulator [Terasakiella sp. A23]MDV7339783.1 LysR family transcriptional regulator [Terasakiella sp. A23]
MSIRALRTLITIAKEGSFAAASNKLGLTQAAISLQIKKLEEEMETALFDRSAHKPQLNTRGHALLAEAEKIVQHYDQLKGIIHQDETFSGPLVIGSINTVQVNPLPSVIREIQDDHPFLQISIKSGLSAELATAVDLGQLDFAITTAPQSILPSTLSWQPYIEEEFFVAAPKDSAENTPKDLLSNHPYVCFDRQAWAGRMVARRLRQDGIATRETMELDSLEATLRMAEASLGVAIVSLPKSRQIEVAKTMKLVPFNPTFYRTIGIISKTDSRWQSVIETFLERLQALSINKT